MSYDNKGGRMDGKKDEGWMKEGCSMYEGRMKEGYSMDEERMQYG